MNKIIFLDIDGVLATSESYKTICDVDGMRYSSFDFNAVNMFNLLIGRTNANVVISSTWRKFYSLDVLSKIFKHEGITCNIIDRTISTFGESDRGAEIREYLSNRTVDSFVIIDDDINDIKDYYPNNLVHVKDGFRQHGLTPENVRQAGDILSRGQI